VVLCSLKTVLELPLCITRNVISAAATSFTQPDAKAYIKMINAILSRLKIPVSHAAAFIRILEKRNWISANTLDVISCCCIKEAEKP